jgi:hypothetical protein
VADNVQITPGVGVPIAADDVGGVLYQRIKPTFGADGSATDVSLTAGLPVRSVGGSTGSVTSTAASITSVTLLAANAARLAAAVYNDSSATLYLKMGANASTSSFSIKVAGGGYFELQGYTGIVDGIWDTANGSARVTEIS